MAKKDRNKTNSMRALDQRKVTYTVHTYGEADTAHGQAFHSAEEVAEMLGMPLARVFKTLVVMAVDKKPRPMLAIVPGDAQLDLKALAAAARQKKLRMAKHDEAESLTGLQVGGISALALLNKSWRVYVDASAQAYDTILVSAGLRGIQIELAPDDLCKVVKATVAKITR